MPPTLQTLGIDRLSVEDRIALAQAIWDSIDASEGRPSLSESQLQELRRRVDEDDADPDNLIPWEQVLADALKSIAPLSCRLDRTIAPG